jgi:hypothetical protein
MATVARAHIESLLRARKLDTTLTSARPLQAADDQYVCATGLAPIDERLDGGLPRGQLSEVVGPRSSGRTAVVLSALAAAASRGEVVALVDTFDTFDPPSARACGVDLSRLLWVRGQSRTIETRTPGTGLRVPDTGLRGATRSPRPEPAEGATPDSVSIDRALKAFSLILQAGGFGLVVFDLAEATRAAIRRLPFTTWFRLQRPIEGSSTACLLLASEPVARSAGGVTIALQRIEQEPGQPGPADMRGSALDVHRSAFDRPHPTIDSRCSPTLFTGFGVEVRIGRARGVADRCVFTCTA